ncbi:MAG: DNA polymerase III subunit gamma/tau, partial [Candidatus Kapaibacteriota bacterium]
MGFIVTARKWRPLRFDEVIGQEHITQTLKNAVRFGRIHHAYLFTGPRGVGKTTTARLLSRVVNCKNVVDGEPCNQCDSCLSILEGRSLDVIEIDGASNNSVDDIRTLRENAKYPPIAGKYKIYIIDEVHMLSTSAFNALLKILEEPPKHLIFVFATTEPHKVLPTIVSRCQRFDFHRLEVNT